MGRIFDDRFTFPGLHRGRLPACRLRVYREAGMPRVVLVATELADNPGASVTSAASGLVSQAWWQFQREVAWPPIMIEHYRRSATDRLWRQRGNDEFRLVEFAYWATLEDLRVFGRSVDPVTGSWPPLLVVAGPRWSPVPGSFVAGLVGEPIGEDQPGMAGWLEAAIDAAAQELAAHSGLVPDDCARAARTAVQAAWPVLAPRARELPADAYTHGAPIAEPAATVAGTDHRGERIDAAIRFRQSTTPLPHGWERCTPACPEAGKWGARGEHATYERPHKWHAPSSTHGFVIHQTEEGQ